MRSNQMLLYILVHQIRHVFGIVFDATFVLCDQVPLACPGQVWRRRTVQFDQFQPRSAHPIGFRVIQETGAQQQHKHTKKHFHVGTFQQRCFQNGFGFVASIAVGVAIVVLDMRIAAAAPVVNLVVDALP